MAHDKLEARNRADLQSFYEERDTDALGRVFDRTAPRLMLLAMRLARDADAAEELLQITFLSVIESRHTYDSSRPVMPWFSKILSNRAADMYRTRARDCQMPPGGAPIASSDANPVDSIATREAIAAVCDAIESIPETYRDVLTKKLVGGLSAVDIANDKGVPADTVRSQLRRGMNLLRERLPKSIAVPTIAAVLSRESLAAVRTRVLASIGGSAAVGSTWTRWSLVGGAVALIAIVSWAVSASSGDAVRESEQAHPSTARGDAAAPESPTEAREAVPGQARRQTPRAPEWRVVYEAAGAPARNVRVIAFRVTPEGYEYPWAPLVTDREGVVDTSALVPGKYWLGRGDLLPILAHTEKSATLSIPGGFTVSGTVVDETDRPVADAEIWLSFTPGGKRGSVVTRSDAIGNFVIPDAASHLFVMARSQSHAWSSAYQVFRSPSMRDHVRIPLKQTSRRVFGLVTDPSGRPVAGVDVSLELKSASGELLIAATARPSAPVTTTTDSRGEYSIEGLRDGIYAAVFGIDADGLGPTLSRVTLSGADQRVDIDLRKGWIAHGVVRDSDGAPAPGVDVIVYPHTVGFQRRATTGADGQYRLEGLAASHLILEAWVPGHGRARVEIQGRLGADRELNLTATRGRWVSGRLVDERGKPLREWLISCPKVAFARTFTDAEGRFLLTNLPGEVGAAGGATLWASRGLYAPPFAWAELGNGDLGDFVVKDENASTASLVGQVLSSNEKPPERAVLKVVSECGYTADQLVDPESGRYEIRGLPVGNATVHLLSSPQLHRIAVVSLEADQTKDLHTFTMQAVQRLFVRLKVPDGAARPAVAVTGRRSLLRPQFVEKGGGLEASLLPGTYMVYGHSPDLLQERLEVTVEPGADVERTLTFRNGIRVHVEFKIRRQPEWVQTLVRDAAGTECFQGLAIRPFDNYGFALAPGRYAVLHQFSTGERFEQTLVVGAEPLRLTVPPVK